MVVEKKKNCVYAHTLHIFPFFWSGRAAKGWEKKKTNAGTVCAYFFVMHINIPFLLDKTSSL